MINQTLIALLSFHVRTFDFKRKNRGCLPLSPGQPPQLQRRTPQSLQKGHEEGIHEIVCTPQI